MAAPAHCTGDQTIHAGNVFNGIIQTSDGGFGATGDSWTPDMTYGGPGL